MYLADFHVHTTYSDGLLSLSDVVDLYGSRGFGAIAITDHLCGNSTVLGAAAKLLKRTLTDATAAAYFRELRDEGQRALDQYGMVVIPGLELTRNALSRSESAHILALGVEALMPVDVDVVEAAAEIRRRGGVAIGAHPVWTRKWELQTYALWRRRADLATVFDAWEVASGPYLFPEVEASGLPMIASSDLHHRGQLRSWKTTLECERHPEAILRAIKRQDLGFHFYTA